MRSIRTLRLALLVAALLLAVLAGSQAEAQYPNVTITKSYSCIGDKTIIDVTASASGCTGPYEFDWTNVTAVLSPSSTTNPNVARYVWGAYTGPCTDTIEVDVTANGFTTHKETTIWHNCHPLCGGP